MLEADYAALVQRHPKNVAIRDGRGDFLWERDDREGAIREWKTAERIEPKNPAVLTHLAAAHVAQGDPRAALGYYLRAAEAEPGNAHTHFSAANVACLFRHDFGKTERESFDLALKHFAEAHRLAPNNPEYARGYAETFYLHPRPDWPTALKIWTNYHNMMPDKNFALINMTRVHMKMGSADSARSCLAQVTGEGNQRLKERLAARIEAELSPAERPKPEETQKLSKPNIDDNGLRP